MANYKLSVKAEAELENILIYGFRSFGLEAAFQYYDDLLNHFAEMSANPLRYPKIDDVLMGSRRSVFKAHAVYYHLVDGTILIERIIGRQNL